MDFKMKSTFHRSGFKLTFQFGRLGQNNSVQSTLIKQSCIALTYCICTVGGSWILNRRMGVKANLPITLTFDCYLSWVRTENVNYSYTQWKMLKNPYSKYEPQVMS